MSCGTTSMHSENQTAGSGFAAPKFFDQRLVKMFREANLGPAYRYDSDSGKYEQISPKLSTLLPNFLVHGLANRGSLTALFSIYRRLNGVQTDGKMIITPLDMKHHLGAILENLENSEQEHNAVLANLAKDVNTCFDIMHNYVELDGNVAGDVYDLVSMLDTLKKELDRHAHKPAFTVNKFPSHKLQSIYSECIIPSGGLTESRYNILNEPTTSEAVQRETKIIQDTNNFYKKWRCYDPQTKQHSHCICDNPRNICDGPICTCDS